VLCGEEDESVLQGVRKVCTIWGGEFPLSYVGDWKGFLRGRKAAGWKVAHLTMYGADFQKALAKEKPARVVVVVGAGKVPKEAYELADFNLAVTNQPHSEIAALSLFLDRLCSGRELLKKFKGKMRIVPRACGKLVVCGENG
jgi:tRNA (cytidine56-2'-O)-methyltransferase